MNEGAMQKMLGGIAAQQYASANKAGRRRMKMAKVAAKPEKMPVFNPGAVFSYASLVVDEHGIAWWVDPQTRRIERVI